MNTTELKALAEKATPGPWIAGGDEDSDYFLVGPCGDDGIVYQSVVKSHSETHADYIAAANPAAILELIAQLEDARTQMERQKDEWLSWEAKRRDLEKAAAQLEDAQGEIRALRATEAGLRERVKELEDGLSWYAENARLCRLLSSDGDAGRIALDSDGGAKARALLEKKE